MRNFFLIKSTFTTHLKWNLNGFFFNSFAMAVYVIVIVTVTEVINISRYSPHDNNTSWHSISYSTDWNNVSRTIYRPTCTMHHLPCRSVCWLVNEIKYTFLVQFFAKVVDLWMCGSNLNTTRKNTQINNKFTETNEMKNIPSILWFNTYSLRSFKWIKERQQQQQQQHRQHQHQQIVL